MLEKWNGPALVFGSWRSPRPSGTRAVLTWDKGEHVGMGDLSLPWKPNTEEIYVIGRGFIGRRTGSVLRHLAVAGCVGLRTSRFHPTEKPVPLMTDLLARCPTEWIVLDPFMGSGTTLVAARELGRRAIGVELSEDYCRIAVDRLRQGVLLPKPDTEPRQTTLMPDQPVGKKSASGLDPDPAL